MSTTKSNRVRKVCKEGHVFYKSSHCPVCPVCEKNNKVDGFLSGLAAPAIRALKSAGIDTEEKLALKTEKEILTLHGMGPGSLPKLRLALEAKGLSFKKSFRSSIIKKGRSNKVDKVVKNKGLAATKKLTAKQFVDRMKMLQSDEELKKIRRYFKSGEGQYGQGDRFMGVKMGQLFALAREFGEMPMDEIEKLLESPIHEARAGAVSIMDKASRNKRISPERLEQFFKLYIKRHDRINNWDLVDLGCLYMTGRYLFDKPRDILYKLARSKNIWERRTAILSTCFFIRQGDLNDTFKIAALLVNDKEDLVHKATGWMLRFAGAKDPKRLIAFLDKHAASLPRTLLRNAIEHFSPKQRDHYLNMKEAI